MDLEARIDHAEAAGLGSPAQAARLREGPSGAVSPAASSGARAGRRRASVCLATVLVVLGGGLALATLLGGGEAAGAQDVAQTLNQDQELGTMTRSLSIILAIILLLLVPLLLVAWIHNSLVNKEETVLAAWAQVESNFQRRADLIPALVETVSRFLKHERETLGEVTAARAAALDRLSESMDGLAEGQRSVAEVIRAGGDAPLESDEVLRRLARAEAGLKRQVTGFLAVAEDYPELRSGDQFLELQAQLEGTENRLNVARQRFNQAVADYNAAIRRLPGSLVASIASFRRKAYFQADEGASEAPALGLD